MLACLDNELFCPNVTYWSSRLLVRLNADATLVWEMQLVAPRGKGSVDSRPCLYSKPVGTSLSPLLEKGSKEKSALEGHGNTYHHCF